MLATKKSKKSQILHYMSIVLVATVLFSLFSFKGIKQFQDKQHIHQEGDSYELKWGDIELTTDDFGYTLPHFKAAVTLDVIKKTNIDELEYSINGNEVSLEKEIFRVFHLPKDAKGEINKDPVSMTLNRNSVEKSKERWSKILERIDEHDQIYIEKVLKGLKKLI